MTEKQKDYLLGSKFTVYTDNNPWVYTLEGQLGAAQICCLSEHALFNFHIKNWTGRSNKTADPLHHHQQTYDSSYSSFAESEEYNTVSYATICEDVTDIVSWVKLSIELMQELINWSTCSNNTSVTRDSVVLDNMVGILGKTMPDDMKGIQEEDPDISEVIMFVKAGRKPMTA